MGIKPSDDAAQRLGVFVGKLDRIDPSSPFSETVAWTTWETLHYLAGSRADQAGYRFAIALRVIRQVDDHTSEGGRGGLDASARLLADKLRTALERILVNVAAEIPPFDESSARPTAKRTRLLDAGRILQEALGARQMPDLFRVTDGGLFPLDEALLDALEKTKGAAKKAVTKGGATAKKYREKAAKRAETWLSTVARYRELQGIPDEAAAARARLTTTKDEATAALDPWVLRATANKGGSIVVLGRDDGDAPAPHAVLLLADCLWADVALRLRDKPAALARVVHQEVYDAHVHASVSERRDGQRSLLVTGPGTIDLAAVAQVDEEVLRRIEEGTRLLSHDIGLETLEWEVTEAHRQWAAGDGSGPFNRIVLEGGWSELAQRLGRNGGKASQQARSVVLAQAHMRFSSPQKGVRGNLLAYTESHGSRGRRSQVSITLGDMLTHGFTDALEESLGKKSRSAREARRLVPLLGPHPQYGRNNEFAEQRRLKWRFALELRDRAEELAEQGAIAMSPENWRRLTDEAGLPHHLLESVLAAWEGGDDNAQPLIVRRGGQVTLHESRKDVLNFLVRGGTLSGEQRERARRTIRRTPHG